MNEAKEMHRDLMNALLPILPRKIYRDIRRVVNLVWAIVGVCLTHTVRLEAWSEVLESRAQYAASRVRRFARFLHNPAIDPHEWYKPLVQAVLKDRPANARLYVALDTTALTPFVLIRASLVYRGRAIPLAWRAMLRASTKVSFADYQPVLDQVHALIPERMVVTLTVTIVSRTQRAVAVYATPLLVRASAQWSARRARLSPAAHLAGPAAAPDLPP